MQIHVMSKDDIEFAFHCTQLEGWSSSSTEIFQDYLQYNPDGCFIAEDNGIPVGICVATPYQKTGFIGELIVLREMRGQGIGGELFRHAVQYLHSCGSNAIYLDGDLQAVPIYEKFGFKKKCLSLRFIGKIPGKKNPEVRSVAFTDMSALIELDQQAFGDDRSFFLLRLVNMYPDYCLVWEKNKTIAGYIMARPGQNLVTAGPMVLNDTLLPPEILLASLAMCTGDKFLRIGVLETNKQAVAYMRSSEAFQEKEPCWRMVLGLENNTGKPEQLFANGSGAKG